jgi:hypothetical protein
MGDGGGCRGGATGGLLIYRWGRRFAGRPVEGARAHRISLPVLPPATGRGGGILGGERERRNGCRWEWAVGDKRGERMTSGSRVWVV